MVANLSQIEAPLHVDESLYAVDENNKKKSPIWALMGELNRFHSFPLISAKSVRTNENE